MMRGKSLPSNILYLKGNHGYFAYGKAGGRRRRSRGGRSVTISQGALRVRKR